MSWPTDRIISVTRRMMANGGRLITHEDITERQKLNAQFAEQHLLLQEQEAKLKAQNLQLDAALNNIVQGLAMFDAPAGALQPTLRGEGGIPTAEWSSPALSYDWLRR
jgi:hypothetical protein